MEQFYLQGSLFTISSVWPEPFGMVGPEAMRFGLPVVGFDAGGIREWLIDGENGFLVPWKDISRYAARIEQLLQDKRLAQQLGECGRERVTAVYSASAQVSRLENIFQKVLEESPGPIATGSLDRRTPDTVAIPRFVEPCLRARETAIQDTAPAIQHAL